MTDEESQKLASAPIVYVLTSVWPDSLWDEDEEEYVDEAHFEGVFSSADETHAYMREHLNEAMGPWQAVNGRLRVYDHDTPDHYYECEMWPVGFGAWQGLVMGIREDIVRQESGK